MSPELMDFPTCMRVYILEKKSLIYISKISVLFLFPAYLIECLKIYISAIKV